MLEHHVAVYFAYTFRYDDFQLAIHESVNTGDDTTNEDKSYNYSYLHNMTLHVYNIRMYNVTLQYEINTN